MLRSRPRGNRLSSDTVSKWLEWLAMRMNGSRLGRRFLPRTRRPMNSVTNGRTTNAKNRICARSRSLRVEVLDIVEEHRGGVAKRVDAVDHAAVPGDERPEVLDADIALHRGHHGTAAEAGQGHEQRDG